jgi:hypothetical protein
MHALSDLGSSYMWISRDAKKFSPTLHELWSIVISSVASWAISVYVLVFAGCMACNLQ